MNYLFITGRYWVIQLRRLIIYVVSILWLPLYSQEVNVDSISINKTWIDNNGKNSLFVKVNALCDPNNPPFDGHKTLIEASLKNKKHNLNLLYDEENYQMKMLLFYEKDIKFYKLNKTNSIFIPFFYCGNWENDVKVSYIIFYNNKKYLYHINYYCGEDASCRLNDNLNLKLKNMPESLKKIFIKELKTKYKTSKDFYF